MGNLYKRRSRNRVISRFLGSALGVFQHRPAVDGRRKDMTAQTATALQAVKTPVAIKQSATDELFDRIEETYDSIARRAFEIFDNNGRWLGHELEDWFRAEAE